ncbi:hypothetical protein RFI_11196 [Reticulomyxa filosa]|uniref:Uncharacterized protein n=1 Tax=Reticulomyxa filosa TaxID=46433 RepID=X6NI12_RETFI|nr:hypothetical protein RFI_11196 [Reticulomyxa filosa]|eukprot:ETO25940.1 hypothetical protein RFI_11196 [Reticulomyxa filosa]
MLFSYNSEQYTRDGSNSTLRDEASGSPGHTPDFDPSLTPTSVASSARSVLSPFRADVSDLKLGESLITPKVSKPMSENISAMTPAVPVITSADLMSLNAAAAAAAAALAKADKMSKKLNNIPTGDVLARDPKLREGFANKELYFKALWVHETKRRPPPNPSAPDKFIDESLWSKGPSITEDWGAALVNALNKNADNEKDTDLEGFLKNLATREKQRNGKMEKRRKQKREKMKNFKAKMAWLCLLPLMKIMKTLSLLLLDDTFF